MTFNETRQLLPTRREVVSRVFRHRSIFLMTFLLVPAAFVLSGQFKPKYQAQMKLLIEKQRVDPVVTTGHDSTPELQTMNVREEELNSQAELLKGEDLGRSVVIGAGLVPANSSLLAVEQEVRKLERRLDVGVIAKTDLIAIKYESGSGETSRRVLATLAALYLQQQRTVHEPASQISFFQRQVNDHEAAWQASEKRLLDFTHRTGVISADLQRELTVRQMEELKQLRMQNTADTAQARGRAEQLAIQLLRTPDRLNTEQRRSDNPQLLNQLNATLLSLQLKRTDLLNKYDANYRLVQDVDREIAVNEAMIREQLASPLHEDSTSANPSRVALETTFADARAQLTGLQAKGSALNQSGAALEKTAQQLTAWDAEQEALQREVKTEKDVFQLYVDKLQQARMTQSLTQGGILNIAVAQSPVAPVLPVHSSSAVFTACLLVSLVLSIAAALLADIFDPTVRTSAELNEVSDLPTLAEFGPYLAHKGVAA